MQSKAVGCRGGSAAAAARPGVPRGARTRRSSLRERGRVKSFRRFLSGRPGPLWDVTPIETVIFSAAIAYPLSPRRCRSTACESGRPGEKGAHFDTYLAQRGMAARVSADHRPAVSRPTEERTRCPSPVNPRGCGPRFRKSQPLGALGDR